MRPVTVPPAGLDAARPSVSFSVRPDAPLGSGLQLLTWTTTFADGSTDVDTMRFVVTTGP